jgi:hypothetical protein
MFIFTHPLAPTVAYGTELKKSIAAYASDHLHEYDVFVIEAEGSAHGLGMEVVDKATGEQLGIVTIH